MIRYAFINNQVLRLFRDMQSIVFPIDPQEVISLIPNCRYLSYQKMAEINHCSVDDVIMMCESKSGCTNYDSVNNRFLILCNESNEWNNNAGRKRWTALHEIGHVICGHHSISKYRQLADDGFLPQFIEPEIEAEADFFAATMAAPFPLFGILGISDAKDVKEIFGLSTEASANRFEQYVKWKNDHRKTSWENDIVKTFLSKSVLV